MATKRIDLKKTKIARAAAAGSNPAEIAILVTRFKDVLAADSARGGRSTEYRMKLSKKHPRVFLKGDDLYVARPGATLRFTLAASAGDKTNYYPVGIAFVREGDRNTSDEQRLGLLNFPQSRVRLEGKTISITDAYQDGKSRVRYKFSVVIQRGSDGKVGIIDPGIIHEDDHID